MISVFGFEFHVCLMRKREKRIIHDSDRVACKLLLGTYWLKTFHLAGARWIRVELKLLLHQMDETHLNLRDLSVGPNTLNLMMAFQAISEIEFIGVDGNSVRNVISGDTPI